VVHQVQAAQVEHQDRLVHQDQVEQVVHQVQAVQVDHQVQAEHQDLLV
jgi:hypothetical protein